MAIVNNASMKRNCWVMREFYFNLCWGTSTLLSTVAALLHNSASSVWGLSFSIASPTRCRVMMRAVLKGTRWELVVIWIWDPWWFMTSSFFLCLSATCMSSLEKWLFKSSAYFLGIVPFFGVWIPYIFWILTPCRMYPWQGSLSIHFVDGFLHCKNFLVWCSTSCLSFILPCLRWHIQKIC